MEASDVGCSDQFDQLRSQSRPPADKARQCPRVCASRRLRACAAFVLQESSNPGGEEEH